MGLFKKLFGQIQSSVEKPQEHNIEFGDSKKAVSEDLLPSITIKASYHAGLTGSTMTDFYVYEWFIKDTGEIFYIGKGRDDRYKEYHERAYEAEKIRKQYDTDIRFVATDLTEQEALDLEEAEIIRVLNETNDRLTNRIIPFSAKRDNGYSRSPSTPPFEFETAPVLYACEIEEHYFGISHRPFDKVNLNCLTRPAFIEKTVDPDQISIIYGGKYDKYYKDVIALLELSGSKILKTKYAKSVTAWIYPCDDYVTNYDIDEAAAEERIGRRIPAYHLIDVWKLLKEEIDDSAIPEEAPVEIHPVNNRCSISEVKHLDNWEEGFDAGFKYAEKADAERKDGNIEESITLLDKARYNGYLEPFLYQTYAKAYRKLKDLDNEIDILEEGISQLNGKPWNNGNVLMDFERQRSKAIAKLRARNESQSNKPEQK